MVEKDDWRLLCGGEALRGQYLDPVSSNEIIEHLPALSRCSFCLDEVPKKLPYYQLWYINSDRSVCVCENCFNELKDCLELKSTDGYDVEWD